MNTPYTPMTRISRSTKYSLTRFSMFQEMSEPVKITKPLSTNMAMPMPSAAKKYEIPRLGIQLACSTN